MRNSLFNLANYFRTITYCFIYYFLIHLVSQFLIKWFLHARLYCIALTASTPLSATIQMYGYIFLVVARYYAPEGGHLRLSFYLENEEKSLEPRF